MKITFESFLAKITVNFIRYATVFTEEEHVLRKNKVRWMYSDFSIWLFKRRRLRSCSNPVRESLYLLSFLRALTVSPNDQGIQSLHNRPITCPVLPLKSLSR